MTDIILQWRRIPADRTKHAPAVLPASIDAVPGLKRFIEGQAIAYARNEGDSWTARVDVPSDIAGALKLPLDLCDSAKLLPFDFNNPAHKLQFSVLMPKHFLAQHLREIAAAASKDQNTKSTPGAESAADAPGGAA